MRVADLLVEAQAGTVADAQARRRPLADAVHDQHRRAVERRRVEGGRSVRHVVRRIQHRHVRPQRATGRLGKAHLHAQLQGRALRPLLATLGRRGQQALDDAVKREQRVLVENHGRQLGRIDERLFEAIVDGVLREARVVLLAREAFLLGCSDDLAVAHQGRGGVVIERRHPEDGDRFQLAPRLSATGSRRNGLTPAASDSAMTRWPAGVG